MNAKSFFSTTMLAYLLLTTITGCSKSTKEADELPELISTVNFPYIANNALYSFDPETEESEKLISFDHSLIVALDTDQSSKDTNDDNVLTFTHSATAEYFVYAKSQALHIYDLSTREDHELYDFKNDKVFDPDTQKLSKIKESYICDIQKVVTWDEESRLAKRILYKDELSVYVKTSSNEQCTNTDKPFEFWQIKIEESNKTYIKRRKILLEHSHDHTHVHNHDDDNYIYASLHGHEHTLKKGELDENGAPFDPNNHKHSHKHVHTFLYDDEHPHQFLNKNEVDAVHNNLKFQEIKFETHHKLVGKKTTIYSIDEALMYSGKPVLDVLNRTFGYLGFNTIEKAYKFYVVNPESENLEKSFLWDLTNINFNTQNNYSNLSDIEILTPKYNRFSTFQYADKNILITSNNKIHFFTLAELFDDDEEEAREASISNPIFDGNISNPSLENSIKFDISNQNMIITAGHDIWSIDFKNSRPSTAELTKRFTEPKLSNIDSNYISNRIFISKSFVEQDTNEHSLVLLLDSGLEDLTVLSRTADSISSNTLNNNIFINIIDADSQNRRAEFFSSDLNSSTEFYESLWSLDTVDYRNNTERNIASILSSDTSAIEPESIASPKLFLFDNDKGEEFGYIPQDIISSNKVVIFTNLYGLTEITDTSSATSTYFFSNQKSSFNFDNEYKVMKQLLPQNNDGE